MNEQRDFHGLWYKPTKSGKHRWSGKVAIEGVEYWVNLFQNEKRNDASPDYSVTFNPVESQQGHNQTAQGYSQPQGYPQPQQGYQQPQQPQQYQAVNPGHSPQQPQQQGVFSQKENIPF